MTYPPWQPGPPPDRYAGQTAGPRRLTGREGDLPPGFADPFPGFPGTPPRRRTGRIAILAVTSVLVAGVGVTAVVLLSGTGDGVPQAVLPPPAPEAVAPSSTSGTPTATAVPLLPTSRSPSAAVGRPTPRETADAVAAGYSTGNRQAVQDLVCTSRPKQVPEVPPGVTVVLGGEITESGVQAEVQATAKGPGGENTFILVLRNERGGWCYLGDR